MKTDAEYMRLAIAEAIKGKSIVEPNPCVGAVIVEDDDVVASGYYMEDGGAHAEANALNHLGRKPNAGAVMYVTLEPCSTIGRTGACTDRLISSGIKRIVIGAIDPNPEHRGRGVEILEQAGITVVSGILEKECEDLSPEFNKKMRGDE